MSSFLIRTWSCVLATGLLSCIGCTVQEEPPPPKNTPIESLYRLAWPFQEDQEGVEIYQTYGQAEGRDSIDVHLGLDIHAPAGTPIYSPLDGTVAAIFDEGMNPWVKGFAIRSLSGGTEFVTKLLHLEPSSIQFALGDQVHVGDFIGELVEWPEVEGYLSHLHIGIGKATLSVKTHRSGKNNPALIFTYNANPLQYLERERDEAPPELVLADSGASFVFRVVERDAKGKWQRTGGLADPEALRGAVDIDVQVRDSVPPGTRFALAPHTVRFELEPLDSQTPGWIRQVVFEGTIRTANVIPYGTYLEVPDGPGSDARFLYHYMAMTPPNTELDVEPNPTPLDLASMGTGRYRVTVYASDLENDVLLGEIVVRYVGARSR